MSVLARIGTTLRERYRLEAVLGVGGMATVYRARHRNGNRVAVKILHSELALIADVRARFLREGYVANRIDHPGRVRVYDDDTTEDGTPFLVMDLLEGKTLEQHIVDRGGVLSPRETLCIVGELLDVLEHAHARGVVHRDLKPENLFLTSEGLKILDFGIARIADGTAAATMTGRILGTPLYMAPEQARGDTNQIGPHTDLWAVGAIMYRLLSGRFVFDEETPERVLIATATRSPPPLAEIAPNVPHALAALVDRSLEPSLDRRFTSAAQMLAAAREIDLDGGCEDTVLAAPLVAIRRRTGRGRASIAAAAVASLALLFAFRSTEPELNTSPNVSLDERAFVPPPATVPSVTIAPTPQPASPVRARPAAYRARRAPVIDNEEARVRQQLEDALLEREIEKSNDLLVESWK